MVPKPPMACPAKRQLEVMSSIYYSETKGFLEAEAPKSFYLVPDMLLKFLFWIGALPSLIENN